MVLENDATTGAAMNTIGGPVLIVQPTLDRARAIAGTLSRSGYACEIAADARDFQRLLQENTYDLLVIELYMEQLDGIELVRWLVDVRSRSDVLLTVSGQPVMGSVAKKFADASGLFIIETAEMTAFPASIRTAVTLLKARRNAE